MPLNDDIVGARAIYREVSEVSLTQHRFIFVLSFASVLNGCGGASLETQKSSSADSRPAAIPVPVVTPSAEAATSHPAADQVGLPVYTVEDLALRSDTVVIASRGRGAEEVKIAMPANAPDVEFSIVELRVDEVLKSDSATPGQTVSVWIPRLVVPAGNLPDTYVLFLRNPPDDFDPTALKRLSVHPNASILPPGVTPIMDISGDEVLVRGGVFYGLHTVDALTTTLGTNGVEPPYVLKLSLDDIRTVVRSAAGPAISLYGEAEVPEFSEVDRQWLEQLDRVCQQSVDVALELRDLLTKAYDEGHVDGVVALDLFERSKLDRSTVEKELEGVSDDLARRWEQAAAALVAAEPLLSRAVTQSGEEFRTTLIEFQASVRSFQMAWSDLDVPNCRQFA